MIAYVDSSSLAKTLIEEPDSVATVALLRSAGSVVTSELAHVELRRLHHRLGLPDADRRVDTVLARCDVVRLDPTLLVAAGRLPDIDLGSLDAIHLATALQFGVHLSMFVTHDVVLGRAAQAHDLERRTGPRCRVGDAV